MGFLVTYLSFCQHIQIVILKLQTEWCHSVTIATCCLRSGFDFSIVYLRIRTMHLEKLHIFGRHNTSCFCFSQEYAIEGHSHCLNHYLGIREGIQGFSLTYLLLTEQKNGSESMKSSFSLFTPFFEWSELVHLWVNVRTSSEKHLCKEVVNYS